MKRTLKAAMEAGDVARVRGILLDALRRKPGNKETLESVRMAMTSVEGIFDEAGEPLYTLPPEEWNESYARSLEAALVKNFTSERLGHYTEVVVALESRRHDPSAPADAPSPAGDSLDEEIEIRVARLTEIVPPEEVVELTEREASDDAEDEEGREVRKGHSATKIFGYVLILLGAAAAIVGMCVPAHFIIGLGIGTLMIGSAIAYIGISSRSRG